MQMVVLQQHRAGCIGCAAVAHQAGCVGQTDFAVCGLSPKRARGDPVTGHCGMAGAGQRRDLIKEGPGPGDHTRATRVVITSSLRGIAHGIRAIERVIQAAPPGIGRIECIAGVHHRHNQLCAGNRSDFRINIRCFDLKVRAFRQEIADLAQERGVRACIMGLALAALVPGIDLCLQRIALVQQRLVAGAEVVDQGGQTLPEGL